MIDKKTAEWKGGDMDQYLRPETLFGTKFESYLNQKNDTRNNRKFNSGYQPRALPTEYAKQENDPLDWIEDRKTVKVC